MSDEVIPTILFPKLKPKLEELGFRFERSNKNELIWGFDGVTKYYPEDTYFRDSANTAPPVSLKLKKTINGVTVILNSIPFKESLHMDKAPLTEEEAFDTVQKYIKLL